MKWNKKMKNKSTKIHNATVMTSRYTRNGKVSSRNVRIKVRAAKDISYNELDQLVYDEFMKDPFRNGMWEGVLWYNN